MTVVCKNCETHFKGHFCRNCGQSADTHDVNLYYFWHEIQHGILHFDSGLFYTIKQLFKRPGHTIREFIDGKRIKHFKPIAFLFLLSTIYGLLDHFFKLEHSDAVQIYESDSDLLSKNIAENFKNILNWMNAHYAYVPLLQLPVTALASYLAFSAFRKSKINYLKHVILNAYITGQITVILLILMPVFILGSSGVKEFSKQIQTAITALFIVWTYIQFFNTNSSFKNIVLLALAYIYWGVIILLTAIAFVAVQLFF